MLKSSHHFKLTDLCVPDLPQMAVGQTMSHLNDVKTVTELPDDSLPLKENLVEDDDVATDAAAQTASKRGQGRGRRAKGRRPGASAATSKSKGDQRLQPTHTPATNYYYYYIIWRIKESVSNDVKQLLFFVYMCIYLSLLLATSNVERIQDSFELKFDFLHIYPYCS